MGFSNRGVNVMGEKRTCSDCWNWIADHGHAGECRTYNDVAVDRNMPRPTVPEYRDASNCGEFIPLDVYEGRSVKSIQNNLEW